MAVGRRVDVDVCPKSLIIPSRSSCAGNAVFPGLAK
jgi:hypothetical protein